MSERSMDWESRVKQGLFVEEVFTNEMKRSVLMDVDRRASYFFRHWKRIAGAMVVLCITVVIATVNWPNDAINKTASSLSDGTKMSVQFKPLDAKDWERGQVINQGWPDILPGLSNKFNPLKNSTNGIITQIPFDDIHLIEERPIEGFGMALRYTLKPDSVTPHLFKENASYFGFTVNGSSQPETLYHYGTGHMYEQQFSMTQLFGHEVLKVVQPICRTDGESCVWYFDMDGDRQVSSYMQLDAASYERDLDGDGKEESIVATYKQNQIYILKEQDGQLLWASVRETLGANQDEFIQYDDVNGTFLIHSSRMGEEDGVSVHLYKEGQLRLLE